MNAQTDFYIKHHMTYLKSLGSEQRANELAGHETIFDHMLSYFVSIGLKKDDAVRIIDNFRVDQMIDSVTSGI